MKPFTAATAVALATAALVSSATAAPTRTAAKGKSVTLHLVEKTAGFNFLDNPPRQGFNGPPLIGDQFAFSADLLTRSGKHAGTFGATCMVARGGVHATTVCYGLYSLKGGDIAGIARGSESNTTRVAIVGGTGVYEGVTGSSVEVNRSDDSPFSDVTVHLIFPQ